MSGQHGPQGPPPGPYGQPPAGGYGYGPAGGYGPPPPKREPSYLGWIALALGVASWVFGTSLMTAVPGVFLARLELKNIREGRSSPDNKTLAQAGFWLSMSHIIVAVLFVALFGCIFGGSLLIPLIARLSGQ